VRVGLTFGGVLACETGRGGHPSLFEGAARARVDACHWDFVG
jgi:hypothetical protein